MTETPTPDEDFAQRAMTHAKVIISPEEAQRLRQELFDTYREILRSGSDAPSWVEDLLGIRGAV